ncbi:perlucin-like protein [Acanthaster planci]|uniref:Perlucin-like protein n=1 Tax=Acanthaster planci TaxID=133434 RepID=A0A8B7YL84_ACAPL|nr:perlucin-like protein [Acanthaster planci]
MNRFLIACVFLVAATAAEEALHRSGCPSGYTYRRHRGHCYKVFRTPQWWQYAEYFCRADGAWLVTIRNRADSVWVNNFFKRNKHNCPSSYWIGANDIVEEGVWRWAQNGRKVTYTNWGPNEPNNSNNEDAVLVYSSSRKWNDHKVDGNWCPKLCFVCETH